MTLQLGSQGPDVRDWQLALIARGHALVADGSFGPRTHNATLAFQSAHALPTTGVVGYSEMQILLAPPTASVRPPPMLQGELNFIECRNYLRVRRVPRNIVLHSIECPEAATRAETTALWMQGLAPDRKVSCHYFVDSDSVVQGVADHFIAYHAAGGNQVGIGIEHTGYARQTRGEWLDPFGQRMLGLSVQLSARLCARWNIPPVYLSAGDLRLGKAGITTHAEVSVAFGKSDHTDPGPGFPTAWYVGRVAALLVANPSGSS
jgi:hypothetical protein